MLLTCILWMVILAVTHLNSVTGCIETDMNPASYDFTKFLGPSKWSRKFPACRGSMQSPILLDRCHRDPSLPDLFFLGHADFRPAGFRLHNTFHTVEVHYSDDPPILTGGPIPNANFVLSQVHFHWGKKEDLIGSEHAFLNGTFSFEALLVHYNTEYPNLLAAMGRRNGILVVAMLFKGIAEDVPEFASLVNSLQKVEMGESYALLEDGNAMSWLQQFHAENNVKNTGYVTYLGSLTAPPCTEKVTWVILQTIGLIGVNQIDMFRKLRSQVGFLETNRRPFQPLNNRILLCSEYY